ncbi:hypothetical protein QJS10_CPB22g00629 [Acorus calamus]|uniref:DUF7086 domain-containing protein n=1 Tax=Acorus calamus TaxID=4465 RepID=A0AAV9C1G8_ACOCL|nr:hypothetical protein QJS10_CPB22g00629 [Acorus calamus]
MGGLAPNKWIFPKFPLCPACGRKGCMKPIISRKKRFSYMYVRLAQLVNITFSKKEASESASSIKHTSSSANSQLNPYGFFHKSSTRPGPPNYLFLGCSPPSPPPKKDSRPRRFQQNKKMEGKQKTDEDTMSIPTLHKIQESTPPRLQVQGVEGPRSRKDFKPQSKKACKRKQQQQKREQLLPFTKTQIASHCSMHEVMK